MSRGATDGWWGKLKRRFAADEPAPTPPDIVIPEVKIIRQGQPETAVSASSSAVDPIFLRQQMSNHLDDNQLQAIGVESGLDYQALPGGKGRKVLELVTAFEKEGKLTHLLLLCQKQNSEIEWQLEKKDE